MTQNDNPLDASLDPADPPVGEVPGMAPDEDAAGVIAQLRGEAKENRDRMLRIAADFENYKKRGEREKADFLKYANERLLREMLPVMDNLNRALESARRTGEAPGIPWGVSLVVQDLQKVLRKFGIEAILATGKPFDPAFHEALHQVESEDAAPGTVIEEVQRGYTLHGRVLRPALVVVAVPPEVTSPGRNNPIEGDA
jgi:molecular chaperone GrpE